MTTSFYIIVLILYWEFFLKSHLESLAFTQFTKNIIKLKCPEYFPYMLLLSPITSDVIFTPILSLWIFFLSNFTFATVQFYLLSFASFLLRFSGLLLSSSFRSASCLGQIQNSISCHPIPVICKWTTQGRALAHYPTSSRALLLMLMAAGPGRNIQEHGDISQMCQSESIRNLGRVLAQLDGGREKEGIQHRTNSLLALVLVLVA